MRSTCYPPFLLYSSTWARIDLFKSKNHHLDVLTCIHLDIQRCSTSCFPTACQLCTIREYDFYLFFQCMKGFNYTTLKLIKSFQKSLTTNQNKKTTALGYHSKEYPGYYINIKYVPNSNEYIKCSFLLSTR